MNRWFHLFFVVLVTKYCSSRIVLPHVPDVLHPPTPDGNGPHTSEVNDDDETDPEELPGLFQGDIALDKVGHNYWKVGLK